MRCQVYNIHVPDDVGVGVPQTSNRADSRFLLLGTCSLLVSFQRLCVDWQSVGGPVRPTFITLVVVVTPNTCSAGPRFTRWPFPIGPLAY